MPVKEGLKGSGWDLYKDGVTQSMISKFLICRHRFWIRYVLGLAESEDFNHRIEYGNLFHAGFEAFAKHKGKKDWTAPAAWDRAIKAGLRGVTNYANGLQARHPQATTVAFWRQIAMRHFPLYCEHWKKSDAQRQYVFQEQVFDVPVELPSGRIVRLRGKYDEGFIEKIGKVKLATLQENKCKGDIDEDGVQSSLHHDLQTMLYVFSLHCTDLMPDCYRILYNVILRPLGGKYPLRQKVSENEKQFIDRVIGTIKDDPAKHMKRWVVELSKKEIEGFRDFTLYPILEQMADWWDSIKSNPLDPSRTKTNRLANTFKPNHLHFCRPFGIFDSLALGNRGDYFQYLVSGGTNRIGLKPRPLFTELDNASLSGT